MEITDTYRTVVTDAHEYMTLCQDRLRKEFKLDEWPRYDWDQDTATLIFSDQAGPRVVATIEFVGSISTNSNTWLWAWANDSLDERVKGSIAKVREFGIERGLEQLTESLWEADEIDGWEMTSIAGRVLNAKGSYRTPKDSGFTYMLMMDVQWVS